MYPFSPSDIEIVGSGVVESSIELNSGYGFVNNNLGVTGFCSFGFLSNYFLLGSEVKSEDGNFCHHLDYLSGLCAVLGSVPGSFRQPFFLPFSLVLICRRYLSSRILVVLSLMLYALVL